jgi:hypothetical protein
MRLLLVRILVVSGCRLKAFATGCITGFAGGKLDASFLRSHNKATGGSFDFQARQKIQIGYFIHTFGM